MVKVKVCGISSLEEALTAVNAGANAIGFVFAPSKRKINPEKAREISLALPPFVSKVGVFVNQERYEVQEISSFCNLDVLQFHGEETPEYCRKFTQTVVKAFGVKDSSVLEELPKYKGVQGFLLDTYDPDLKGGTGRTFNWQIAAAAKDFGPVVLAGGLKPGNIKEAILKVRPYGVDVSSGVELEGKKSAALITEFFGEIRRSLDELSKLSNA
ncbi:MAG: phosphoribosylanthranilate isomerase [Bacillota bacterium]|nr:phosphoribosylanthranilate isomerase [Bacillota bacterium]